VVIRVSQLVQNHPRLGVLPFQKVSGASDLDAVRLARIQPVADHPIVIGVIARAGEQWIIQLDPNHHRLNLLQSRPRNLAGDLVS